MPTPSQPLQCITASLLVEQRLPPSDGLVSAPHEQDVGLLPRLREAHLVPHVAIGDALPLPTHAPEAGHWTVTPCLPQATV